MSKDAKYEFKVHESATQRLCSATALVKLLLLEEPTILLEHRKEFLKLALWKITEAESVAKDRTRYCSATAYKSPETSLRMTTFFSGQKWQRNFWQVVRRMQSESSRKQKAARSQKRNINCWRSLKIPTAGSAIEEQESLWSTRRTARFWISPGFHNRPVSPDGF